ncbi:MAG: hypothetical protein IGS03_15795 [Candidatus Sericytochromatia bacterium]|nr:hypothetical protein [Candidatus Sericytochromatia bacterium]
MGSLSVNNNQTLAPIQQTPATAPKAAAPQAEKAAEKHNLGKDALQWGDVPTSTRVKTATATTFKQTIITYTVAGSLAGPVTGAAVGGFIGLFSGQAGKFAVEGAKMGARYMLHGTAAGAAISGVDALAMGTLVGTSPDRASAATRAGVLSGLIGLLGAEDALDIAVTGVGAAAEASRAGRIYDKTLEQLQK